MSPIKFTASFFNLTSGYPIYCNFKTGIERFVYTRYGIMANLKKPGLVDEALGNLLILTPELIYHL